MLIIPQNSHIFDTNLIILLKLIMCIAELERLYSGHVLNSYDSFKEVIAMPVKDTICDCCNFDFKGSKMVQFKIGNTVIGQECLLCYKSESKE